jgi:hypothetical protein
MIAALLLLAHLAAADADPVLGTWELDVAKSTFDPGPPLKSQTRTYEQTAKGVKFTLHGSPSVNSVSLKLVDRFTAIAVEKKDGKPMFNVRRVVSSDGQTMTVTSVGTNVKGVAIRNLLVFRRSAAAVNTR